MASPRALIHESLFLLLTSRGNFRSSGKRLKWYTEVSEQPALFLRWTGDEYLPRATRMPAKVAMGFEVWLYSNASEDPDVPPADCMMRLVDLVEQLLRPAPLAEAQTLNGLVTHCWLEGKQDFEPGDLAGQAIMRMDIKALVPSLNGG